MTAYLSFAFKSYVASYSGVDKNCWPGIILSLIATTAAAVSFFLSVYLVNELHFTVATAGLIVSCYGLGTATGGILGGKLADRFSPRLISILSLLLQSIAFLILLQVSSALSLAMVLALLGIAFYGFKTSNNIETLRYCKSNENELSVINLLYVASNLGIGISAVIVSVLERYSFHSIFLLSSVLLIVAAAYLLFHYEKKKLLQKSCQQDTSDDSLHKASIVSANNKKIVAGALCCLFFMGLIVAQRGVTYLLFLHETLPHLGLQGVSLLFALNPILIVFFQTSVVHAFRHANKILMVGVGAFIMSLGMFILSFSPCYALAILSCLIYTLGEMLFFTTAQLVTYQRGAQHKKGQSMGLFQMVYAISIIAGPTIGGFIYHHLSANTLWHLSGLMGLFCLMLCLYCKRFE